MKRALSITARVVLLALVVVAIVFLLGNFGRIEIGSPPQ